MGRRPLRAKPLPPPYIFCLATQAKNIKPPPFHRAMYPRGTLIYVMAVDRGREVLRVAEYQSSGKRWACMVLKELVWPKS